METWASKNGKQKSHRNDILVEVLGKEAQSAYEVLVPGEWVNIDGYLRSDQYKGKSILTVRVYNISYKDKTDDTERKVKEETQRRLQFSIRD